ncbi:MAG: DNA helicase RecQ [Candidatus Methanoperedens sp.]|nr:DNA helicase RecQ [Candidatus Methanoperedens sp.]
MQACSTCEDNNKCRLKEAGFFDICPRLSVVQDCTEKVRDYTERSACRPHEDLNHADARIDYGVLRRYFGYSKFRPLQSEIILDILDRKDVLVLMPTGGGKSLCYQYPSLLFNGITVVVSPLISLMKNQVDSLRSNGIDAAYINSSLDYSEIKRIKYSVEQTRTRLLYIAPERLTTPSFLGFLRGLRISLFAIDEAHCISEWGHDFRPEYRQLRLIRESFPDVPIIALTATATPKVQDDIIAQLNLRECKKYVASFNRKNLVYSIRPKEDTFKQIVQFLNNRQNESGIIYCQSRKTVDTLAIKLQQAGYRVLPYHAGLPQDVRSGNQEKFIKDDVEILVATIAFGMGIDKPNIRFVIHYDLPKNLEAYYQETGRAGRDGLKSDCILFYSYGDRQKIEYFINQMADERERQIALNKLRDMINFCESSICRRKVLLGYFGEELEGNNCGGCDNCLNPKEKTDAVRETSIILSCIDELGERFGIGYVADVITGSKSQRLMVNGHESLKSYGSGKDLPKKSWHAFIKELIQLGYLELEGETYPVLRLNQRSRTFLTGCCTGGDKEKVFLTKPEVHEKTVEIEKDAEYDGGLFEVLRVLRKKLADAENYPPYIIFTDASLKQMAALRPRSLYEFRKISGVGDRKLEKYGAAFIKEISGYCEKNNIVRKDYSKTLSSEYTTLEMLNQTLTPEEIALKRELALSTIYTHIENLIIAGEDIPVERFIKKEKIDIITKAVLEIGAGKLKPIRDKLGDDFSYDEIRLVRAKMSMQP